MAENLAEMLSENSYSFINEAVEKLSVNQKKRVCALKKLQLSTIEVETEFYERVHALEKEFEGKFAKFFEQRRKIISGEYEPTEEESELPLIHGLSEEDLQKIYEMSKADDNSAGVPEFWLGALRASEAIGEMIQECDEPILKHLIDITSTVEIEPPGFTLYFHFSPNEYFSNTVLKKHYELTMKADPEDPFEYDGPSVTQAIGDEIKWAEGKNVTKKVVKKKSKKGTNAGKFLTKTVDNDSFFTFFSPKQVQEPTHADDDEEAEEEYQAALELRRADFEVGQVIRDHIIPRAVLHFTGEADMEGDLMDFEDEDDGEDYSDEDDEE